MENISFEEFSQMLDEVAGLLPQEIYKDLNGGVNLLPETPAGEEPGLLILGQYLTGGGLGRFINIYYGSFMALYCGRSREFLKRRIDEVLRHEFLHHLESLAGEKDLEIQDAIDLERYRQRMRLKLKRK